MSKYKPNLRLNLSLERKELNSSGLTRKHESNSNTPRKNLDMSQIKMPLSVKNIIGIPKLPISQITKGKSDKTRVVSTSRARSSKRVNNENISINPSDGIKSTNISSLALRTQNSSKSPRKTLDVTSPKLKESNVHQVFESLNPPLSTAVVLKYFKKNLTFWEQGEILDFNQIYFLGNNPKKFSNSGAGLNNGFDDENGDYKVLLGDQINYRYEIIQQIGKGSFGQVFKSFDHKEKEFIAIKIIKNKRRFHQQGAVEVSVLKKMLNNDPDDKYNVIHMKDSFTFRKHLCINFELLNINLFDFIKSNHFHGLSLPLIRKFAIQILQCLKLARRLNIIHCDLKPENVLLRHSNRSSIKVIDFGSACFNDEKIYTYIQSRFYRAPEIILGIPYTTAIDV